MRWEREGTRGLVFGIAVVAALLTGTGCASDCETICGKLDFCQLLVDLDLQECVDRCEDRKGKAGDNLGICADCADQSSCNTIANGSCQVPCSPLISSQEPGTGGTSGAGGLGGEGGLGGIGGLGGAAGEGGAGGSAGEG